MKPVIDPVAADLIENELTPERLLRRTNNGGNEIYVMRAQECPNLMREIGRLRELSFRDGGGGTGADVDIDELDLDPEGYEQLFVWDPKAKGDRRRLPLHHLAEHASEMPLDRALLPLHRTVPQRVPALHDRARTFVRAAPLSGIAS